jgi:homoserine O-acetyltransferase
MLGNGQSSSPSNSGLGVDFPATTMFDVRQNSFPTLDLKLTGNWSTQNVAAQYKLVTELFKIKTLFAVTGWSMGAGQSYQWAVSYPEMVERIVPFCGAARTYVQDNR